MAQIIFLFAQSNASLFEELLLICDKAFKVDIINFVSALNFIIIICIL